MLQILYTRVCVCVCVYVCVYVCVSRLLMVDKNKAFLSGHTNKPFSHLKVTFAVSFL